MSRTILIIQGHPDPGAAHFCHALAQAYGEGARTAGHAVEEVRVATLDFPLLRTMEEWKEGATPAAIRPAQEMLKRADHLVIFYPLWFGTMPAVLKGFLEQWMRPGVALDEREPDAWPKQLLKGKSARVVVTMGMPGFIYRWYFLAHSLRSLERNILKFCGVAPVRDTVIGLVEGMSDAKRARWLDTMRSLGAACR